MPDTNDKIIAMLGTRFDTMGGISSVVNVYRAAGLFDRWPIRYITTHCDGGRFAKLQVAVAGLLSFVALLLSGKVAVVHIHVSSSASFWRKLAFLAPAYIAGKRVVLHLHSGRFHQFYEQGCGPLGKWLVRYAFDHAACAVVLSEGWKSWLQTISSNPNIVAIYNPVEVPAHTVEGRFDHFRVICLGRVCRAKGSYDLLKAATLLKARHPRLEMVLAGDGDIAAFAEDVRMAGMETSIRLPGWIRGEGKQRLLDTASIYALPSYGEGLPMSLLEAMANGIPVISTRVGGIPETVADGADGFLINPGDVDALVNRLDQLLSDREAAARFGAAAREKILGRFSTETVLPQIEAVYLQLGARPV